MFRPNTTADLSEFPALGTPPTQNRSATTATTPSLASRMASYASTASSGFPPLQHHDMGLNRNAFDDLTSNRTIPPRSFSIDEFPALGRSNAPLEKPEQWLDYANLREQQGGKTASFFFLWKLKKPNA